MLKKMLRLGARYNASKDSFVQKKEECRMPPAQPAQPSIWFLLIPRITTFIICSYNSLQNLLETCLQIFCIKKFLLYLDLFDKCTKR